MHLTVQKICQPLHRAFVHFPANLRACDQSKWTSWAQHGSTGLPRSLEVRNAEAMVFGYCTEVIFHRDATSLLESSVHLGRSKSDEEECIGRKLAVVGEVEGSRAEIIFVNSDAIFGQ